MFPTNKFTNLLLSAPYNFPHSPLNWINCPKDQTICTPRHFSRTWYLKLPCLPHFDISSLFQITPISFQHGIASACFFLSLHQSVPSRCCQYIYMLIESFKNIYFPTGYYWIWKGYWFLIVILNSFLIMSLEFSRQIKVNFLLPLIFYLLFVSCQNYFGITLKDRVDSEHLYT